MFNLRVQVPKHDVYTPNHNYDSYYRNHRYFILGYVGHTHIYLVSLLPAFLWVRGNLPGNTAIHRVKPGFLGISWFFRNSLLLVIYEAWRGS